MWNRCNTVFFLVIVLTIFTQYFGRKLWVWRLTNDLPLSLPCRTQWPCYKRVPTVHTSALAMYCFEVPDTNVIPSNIFSSVFHLILFISVFHHEVYSMWISCVSKGYPCKGIVYIMFYLHSIKDPTGSQRKTTRKVFFIRDYNPNSLRWRHNGCDSDSNHQPHDCLLKCLFGRISK